MDQTVETPSSANALLTADQCRSARHLLGLSVTEFANLTKTHGNKLSISRNTIQAFENPGRNRQRGPYKKTVQQIEAVFRELGIGFLPQDGCLHGHEDHIVLGVFKVTDVTEKDKQS